MVEEVLACIKEKDIKYLESGQISKYVFPVNRKQAHIEKISHLIVRIFIITVNKDGEILYLVQKRSKNKRGYPDHYTDSASGHVTYEDDLNLAKIRENAFRELEEEFGISEDKIKNLNFQGLEIEKDQSTGELAYIFFGLVDNDVILAPDPEELETEESRFYSKTELESILSTENAVDYSKKIWKNILKTDILNLFKTSGKLEQKTDVGLFIGRFQPLHLGHLHVIEKALTLVKKLKIGIGSAQLSETKNDPFTSEERKLFIRDALKNKNLDDRYEIFEIPDIFDAKNWVNHVISIVGNLDVIFSNSDWVRELFFNKGYQIGDKLNFKMKEFNATRIRNYISEDNPEWKELVPKEIVDLIEKANGIERIKRYYKENK